MITAGDFRNGVTFEMDGQVMQVVEFQHVKPGKGAAFVRTKMKNVITGSNVTETSFNPTAKFESASIDRMDMEYSYNDGNLYYFMNPETYELGPVDESVLSDNFKFVKENMICSIYSYKGKVFNVVPPINVVLEVAGAVRALPATPPPTPPSPPLSRPEAVIKVTLFIEPGEKIIVDTRTGEYAPEHNSSKIQGRQASPLF